MKKGQLIPDAAEMKAQKQKGRTKFYAFMCVILMFGLIISLLHEKIARWAYTGSYSQIYVSFYKANDKCIDTYYPDQKDNSGMILLKDRKPIPEGCGAEHLGSDRFNVYPDMTDDEVHIQSLEMHNKLVDLQGNILHIDRVVRNLKTENGFIRLEDGEIPNFKRINPFPEPSSNKVKV